MWLYLEIGPLRKYSRLRETIMRRPKSNWTGTVIRTGRDTKSAYTQSNMCTSTPSRRQSENQGEGLYEKLTLLYLDLNFQASGQRKNEFRLCEPTKFVVIHYGSTSCVTHFIIFIENPISLLWFIHNYLIVGLEVTLFNNVIIHYVIFTLPKIILVSLFIFGK